ncbi:MAG: PAS domain-containing protein, partial [Actinobacteria bacterium]|nr:PAS domain-containing protein [Actinomycetota bacterium]
MKIVTESLEAQALAASGLIAWRWDAQADRMEWSPGAEEILGLPDIVLRSPDLVIRVIHPDDVELIKGQFCQALKTGAPLSARFRVTAPGLRWFDCSGQAVLSDTGESIGATGTFAEVTEECEAEEAVLGALRDAERALEQIGARVWEWDPKTDLVTYFNLPDGTHMIADSPTEVPLSEILA